jgi:hypothetical protein
MRSPDEATPAAADDDDRPQPTRHDRVLAELARKTALIADDRAIAQAQAKKVEHLVELQDWSETAGVAAALHGNPASTDSIAALTPEQARAAHFSRWEDNEVVRRTIVSETACLTNVAERTVERLMDEARFLYYYAPATFEALAAGEISYRHANVLVDQLRTLPLDDQAGFEEKVLASARTMPVGRFRDKVRRSRERMHPESIVTRNREALAKRGISWEPEADGMGTLHWYGAAEQTKAAYDRIHSMAAGLKKRGDPTPAGDEGDQRRLDQLRADLTAALLLDGITTTGLGTGVTGTVMVTVSADTLLGRSDDPAVLEGYGPISPEAARRIAADVPDFTRLLTHPETGVVLSLGKTRYKNTRAMKRWLRLRDEVCRFPGCTRPAQYSDIDHTDDWANGGTTDHNNLAHLCEAHHRLKHLSKWQVRQEAGGVLMWTSPGKRVYRTEPANQMGPPRPKPPATGSAPRKGRDESRYLRPKPQPKLRPSPPPLPDNPPF